MSNIHQLIATGLVLASDEGADIIVLLDDEHGDLVAYTGRSGEYSETERRDLGDADDLGEICEEAEAFLDDLVNVEGEEGDVIEGSAEAVDD